MGWFSRWSRWNIAVCDAIENQLPKSFTRSLLHLHELSVAKAVRAQPNLCIVDVGGGANTPFATGSGREDGMWLIGTDILFESLRINSRLDDRVVSDACGGLPFKDNSVDIISTRSVMEHLPDNTKFLADCHRILKPKGLAFCVMPSRRAPFAWVNRLLPQSLKQRLLYTFFPQWRESCGFYAYYNHCAWPEMTQCFASAGFRIKRIEFRYYQSIYFKFLIPLFLIVLLYDLSIWILSQRRLCCQMFIVAERE